MQQQTDIWRTTTGKLVILGGGGILLLVAGIFGIFLVNIPSPTPVSTEEVISAANSTATAQVNATITAQAEKASENATATAMATAELAAPTQTALAATTQAEATTARQTADAALISGALAARIATATANAMATVAAADTATTEALADATPTPAPTDTPRPRLETTEDLDVSTSTDVPGQINIEYPARMSPGSSDSIFVTIYIPDGLVSLILTELDRIEIPPDAAPIIGEPERYEATILIREVMRVELSSPKFEIRDLYPPVQPVDINTIDKPTYWAWTIVAPNDVGVHVVAVQVYPGADTSPSWVRSIAIKVTELTPTPLPTPTFTDTPLPTNTSTNTPTNTPIPTPTNTPIPTPTNTPTYTPTNTPIPTPTTVPFIQTPAGTATIGTCGTIIAALITGLITFLVARDSFPIFGTKASYRRTLKTLHGNLARLEEQRAQYGLDVPTRIENEIEVTKEKIAEIEEKLSELESK